MKSYIKAKKDKIFDTPHKNKFNFMSMLPALDTKQERKNILTPLRNSKNVIIGSYAFNKQQHLTIHQKRPLTDIDIKSNKPRYTALKIERGLDNSVGFNNYYVSVLNHDDGTTYRVHSRARNDVVADVSLQTKRIPFNTLNNVRYETLSHRKKEVQRMLHKPSASYRRDKDKRMMGYIKRSEDYDSDKDGVPNWRDCKPFDKNKQGWFHERSKQWAKNVNTVKKEEPLESKIKHGVAMGMRKAMRPQNYHISHNDRIETEDELRRRVIEKRVQELMQHGLTSVEAEDIAYQELSGEQREFAHDMKGRILWQKYRPVTKEMCFSHFPNG